MNINKLHDILVQYIEDNKTKYDIAYSYSLASIDSLVSEIYKEYLEIINKENKENGREE